MRPPVRTGPPTGTISTRAGSTTPSRSGTSCGADARSRTPSASAASICPTRYDDVRAIAYDTDHFSSRRVAIREVHRRQRRRRAADHLGPAEAPRWRAWCCCRRSRPRPSRALTPKTRTICNELIDAFIDKGRCDAAVDYAQHIPVARHRPHAGRAGDATAICSATGSTPSSTKASPTTTALMQRPGGDDRVLPALHGSAPRAARRRSHQLSGAADLSGRLALHRQPRAGLACACCWLPASTRPGAASARASGTSPRIPRIGGAWSPTPR